jgi:hypothetical protein
MAKLISTILLFSFLACRDNNSRQTFIPPNSKDVNEIINAVINQDSLRFRKKATGAGTQENNNEQEDIIHSNTIPLSVDLRKIRVIAPDAITGVPPPVDLSSVSIFELFNIAVNNQRFFNKIDSSYLFFQNDAIKKYLIDTAIAKKLAMTSLSEQQQKFKSNQLVRYYDLTIPILSADNNRAYVELTSNCQGCGGATAFYLEKTNSKWVIVGWQRRWRN